MYYNLSIRNLKRSFKDYAIYFLTLTFAVCIFYSFNSIEAQKIMKDISGSQRQVIDMVTKVMAGLSILVSIILSFLIIYANNFLIKRRKKEFGVYMTLGMGRNNVSKILFLETLIIGILSLAVGLLMGLFSSQALSLVTAKMFEINMSNYKFIFSESAVFKTIGYFSIIFIFVMFFNYISISKYKLIDLIYASRKNESINIKYKKFSFILFLLSVILLIIAYIMAIRNNQFSISTSNYWVILFVLGGMGTLFFFISLSSFVMRILQFNDKVYFKNLNMFVARQINSKINTNYISITLICLMLFLSIEVLSSGLALNNSLSKSIKFDTPYDATIDATVPGEENTEGSIVEELQRSNININNFTDSYVEYKTYDTKLSYLSILDPNAIEKANKNKKIQGLLTDSIEAMKLTDFNKLMLLQGKKPIKLGGDEYAIISNTESTKILYTNLIKIKLNGNELRPKYDKSIYVNTETGYDPYNYGTIVVGDKNVNKLHTVPFSQKLCIQYKSANKELISKKINTLFKNTSKSGEFSQYSKVDTYVQEQGNSISFAFIGIYLGLVFLITSVAILSLQQLSECADSIERYKILRKIGVEERTINKSIFIQTAIYFFTPLSLAIIHSIAGLKLANDILLKTGATNIIGNIIFAAICICIIYGGYFLATYIGAKNIIKNSN